MRRPTPNSHSRLRACFRQANAEVSLATGKATTIFDFTDAPSALALPFADYRPSPDHCLPMRATLSAPPLLNSLGLSTPWRAFKPHNRDVGPRFSTTDF